MLRLREKILQLEQRHGYTTRVMENFHLALVGTASVQALDCWSTIHVNFWTKQRAIVDVRTRAKIRELGAEERS